MERNIELKALESHADSFDVAIAGACSVEPFGPYMQQGTTDGTRIGDKITVKTLSLKFNVKLNALEADGTSLRLVLLWDRRPAGAQAAVTDIFEVDDMLTHYNVKGPNKGRFQFLFDRMITFDSVQGEWNDNYFIQRDFQVEFQGNAGTIADVEKGLFILAGFSKGNAAAITVNYGWRFRYTDD